MDHMKDKLITRRISVTLVAFVLVLSMLIVPTENAFGVSSGIDVKTTQMSLGVNTNAFFPATAPSNYMERYYFYRFNTLKYPGIQYRLTVVYNGEPSDSTANFVNFGMMDSNAFDEHFPKGNRIRPASGGYGLFISSYRISEEARKKSEVYNLDGGKTYYVAGLSAVTDDDISCIIRVDPIVVVPTAPVIRYLKPGKKKVKVGYFYSRYADNYQIQIRKGKGKWKTYTNGKKLSKTIKKLKKGKTYSIRIRAQRNVNGKWYTGEWSSVRKFKSR